jgi:hypothetical protein
MKRYRRRITLCVLTAVTLSAPLAAFAAANRNLRKPGIGYIYPAGGQKGQTFEAKIAGRYLDGISEVVVSGEGVRATLIEHVKPLNGKELNLLRDRMKVLQSKVNPKQAEGKNAPPPAAVEAFEKTDPNMTIAEMKKEMAELRLKLANPKNRNNRENPQLGEDVKLKVTIAADARPGPRELRLKTNMGLSNPLIFNVGQITEYGEKEPNNQAADENAPAALPIIFNGQIMPGDVDRFPLKLAKGQKLVMAVSARELIPYLADAVPGWFQATLALYDDQGKEVAYADDYRFNPDPVLFYEIPQDGQYVLEIKDAIYRGREDFVYRIAVGEFPYITSIFPLGAPVGEKATVKITGWNLPVDELKIPAEQKQPGVIPVSVRKKTLVSNTMPFAIDELPESMEREPNNRIPFAQTIKPGLILNGRIDQPGDTDIFKFEGKAGEQIVAEIHARRLNSPLDSVLKLTDASGKMIASNDDQEDKACGLETHHADSLLTAALPADGTYYIHLADAQDKGSSAYAYRLRISHPMPDFQLRAVPSTLNVRAGATVPITVYAMRRDGFEGDININLVAAPEGFTLQGPPLTAEKDNVKMTIKAPPTGSRAPVTLQLSGRATIDGQDITRKAVPADDMMQAFLYRHLVPAQDLKVAVIGKAKRPATTTGRPANKKKTS